MTDSKTMRQGDKETRSPESLAPVRNPQSAIRNPQSSSSVVRLTDDQIAVLVAHAARARESAYAPYSRYLVGAAALAEDDRVFFGCNVENASYGLSLCAERTAMAAGIAAGVKRFKAVVVVTEAYPPGTPCGACRQWMAEFGGDALEVLTATPEGRVRRYTLADLLPAAFRITE